MSARTHPRPGEPGYTAYAVLSNDVAAVPVQDFLNLGDRELIAGHLWRLGYRRPGAGHTTHRWQRTSTPGDLGDGLVEHAAIDVDELGHVVIEEAALAQLMLDAGWERTA